MWNTILFDLDGTLTDSKDGIINSVKNALDYFGIQEKQEDLLRFVGPPLHESFQEYYGFDQEQITVGIEKFREYFNTKGWLENAPYPGIAELLKELKAAGKTLLVATSKPEEFAVRILEHFGLAQYFDHICGAPMNEQKGAKKSVVIENALSYLQTSVWGADAVMVGDRRQDVAGGHETGLPVIGVLYGYGDRQELEDAEADFIVKDVDGLGDLLLFDTRTLKQWYEAFGGECEEMPCHHLWGAFDCGKVPALRGEEARDAFDSQVYDVAVIFRCYSSAAGPVIDNAGMTAKISAAELAQEETDVCVTDRDFRWTYIQPRRSRYAGPFFCRIDDIRRG